MSHQENETEEQSGEIPEDGKGKKESGAEGEEKTTTAAASVPDPSAKRTTLFDDPNEMKKVSPTKRYAPKAKKVVIPFVIPWENQKAKETQHGSSFGGTRNAVTKVTGSKELKQGELNSETILTCFAEGNKFASQKGMRSFGAPRQNISSFVSSKVLEKSRIQAAQGIIPMQSGRAEGPSQSGETPIGASRRQVPRIKFKDEMTKSMDPESASFISRLMIPNPNNKAGTGVIDTRRQNIAHVIGGSRHDKLTEAMLPKLLDYKDITDMAGTGTIAGLGLFRQVVTPVKGGYEFSLDEIRASRREVPWATAPSLSSQKGTGGFQQNRDVVSHVKYKW